MSLYSPVRVRVVKVEWITPPTEVGVAASSSTDMVHREGKTAEDRATVGEAEDFNLETLV